jgi:virulence factor Mce-like protein
MRRGLLVGAVLAAGVLAIVIVKSGGRTDHEVRAILTDASDLQRGSQVRIGGQVVGHVQSVQVVDRDRAEIDLTIDDSRAWPLRQGTRMSVNWLGTISYAGRYVALEPPIALTPPIPQNGLIPANDVQQPVELDQILQTFDATGRRDLRQTLQATGTALDAAAPSIGRALVEAPDALGQARSVLVDLGSDPVELNTLVRTADRVTAAVASADPGIAQLISGAQSTFAAVALKSTALEQTLAAAPAALAETRGTLAHADRTLAHADTLASRLHPGVEAIRRATPDLQAVLQGIIGVAPPLETGLQSLRGASPPLSDLFVQARANSPQLDSLATQATPQVGCIRPFAPEIAGLASVWNGFLVYGDKTDKYARVTGSVLPFQGVTTLNSGQVEQLFPQLRYAFPRPPGEVAGQPWFQPQCDLGPDTLVPADDPEGK